MTNQFILLVEDDPRDQELIIRALHKSGVESEIAVARDGAEALGFLFGTGQHAGRNLEVMPALVLLDLRLPRVGGLEVLRRIRAHRLTRHLPVIVITAVWNPEQIVSGFRLQADGFVCKSADVGKLSEALGNLALDVLLGRRRRHSVGDALEGFERRAPGPNLVATSACENTPSATRFRRSSSTPPRHPSVPASGG